MQTLGHSGKGSCTCTERDQSGIISINPECTVIGHSATVTRVQFSDDAAQVLSCSDDGKVLFWDIAEGRTVRQIYGCDFALVEGLSDEHKRGRHVLIASNDKLLIYECAKEQRHGVDGAVAAPVACFKAPNRIESVRCRGAAICVGCDGGAVCILSAPFLAA